MIFYSFRSWHSQFSWKGLCHDVLAMRRWGLLSAYVAGILSCLAPEIMVFNNISELPFFLGLPLNPRTLFSGLVCDKSIINASGMLGFSKVNARNTGQFGAKRKFVPSACACYAISAPSSRCLNSAKIGDLLGILVSKFFEN